MTAPRMLLTFAISSYVLLGHIESEFRYHRHIATTTDFDDGEFLLTVECDATDVAMWEVRVVISTFDSGSAMRSQSRAPDRSTAQPER